MVPVSKLLHFYNPTLFPMYDGEYIWKRVCWGAFKQDNKFFCKQQGYSEANEISNHLNLQYTLWAARVMQNADKEIMPMFAEWFSSKVEDCNDPQAVVADLAMYYATAFEFIALGAAFIEGRK